MATTIDQTELSAVVREALGRGQRLRVAPSSLSDDASLYDAGLTSHATVHLMLDLEDELDIEIPERLVTRATFASIDAIVAALAETLAEEA